MPEFYSNKVLSKLRNRSYFEQFFGDILTGEKQFIRSEGAWRITLRNGGDTVITLTDGAGGQIRLLPAMLGPSSLTSDLILGGDPAVIRDDEIEFDFGGAGSSYLAVVYDRMVYKKEDNDYPVDEVLKAVK